MQHMWTISLNLTYCHSVDSRSGYLLVNGNPAELQCFDPLRNYCVDSFQVFQGIEMIVRAEMTGPVCGRS